MPRRMTDSTSSRHSTVSACAGASCHWEGRYNWEPLNFFRSYLMIICGSFALFQLLSFNHKKPIGWVRRAFPSCTRSILTGVYLCHACSCQEIEGGNARAGGERPQGRAGQGHAVLDVLVHRVRGVLRPGAPRALARFLPR
jgi:hypothetical protein